MDITNLYTVLFAIGFTNSIPVVNWGGSCVKSKMRLGFAKPHLAFYVYTPSGQFTFGLPAGRSMIPRMISWRADWTTSGLLPWS